MQDEIQELKLPTGPRDRALLNARSAVANADQDAPSPALQEAFATLSDLPRRTDDAHQAGSDPARWNPQLAAQAISAQLTQLDEQRRQLAKLLESLE